MTSAVLLLLLVAAAAADPDYCNVASCGNVQQHTMCLYPTSGAASSCGTVHERDVSAADQTEILAAHNTIRQDVKNGQYANNNLPAATSMPDLTWDQELAAVAQRWVDQCLGGHDQCRNVPSFKVGQNAAWTWGYAKSWTKRALGQWFFDELPDFQQQNLTFVKGPDPVSGGGTGHLTQVIWADTTKVGCGYIAVPDSIEIPNHGIQSLVKRTYICNYGPAGNMSPGQIYQEA